MYLGIRSQKGGREEGGLQGPNHEVLQTAPVMVADSMPSISGILVLRATRYEIGIFLTPFLLI